jgi:predicted permease
MVALGCALGRWAGRNWCDSAFGALVATFPNSGFMGVPLVLGLLGASAAGPTMAAIMLDMVVTSSVCVALAHVGAGAAQGQGGVWRAVRQALSGVARNPMPWAVLAGAAASALQWSPPRPVATTVGLLAGAATPVALFSIGAVLWRARLAAPLPDPEPAGPARSDTHARGDDRRDVPELCGLVALKLVVHPVLVWVALRCMQGAGVAIPQSVYLALPLVAGLPGAGNVSLLAERFGADNGRVARVILWTTLLAVLSFNAIVWLSLPGAG